MSVINGDDEYSDELISELELIQFSPEVQSAIEQVIPRDDPLDAADFNPVDYINSIFPTEQSLANIDQVLNEMESKVRTIDGDIRTVVREQTNVNEDGRSALLDAQRVISQLFVQVRDIKAKAESSEEMVRGITRDIKQLDCAKRNLTTAITTLNHLHMLVAGVEDMRKLIKNRQYGDIVLPLQGITEVINNFYNYKDIPQIEQLSSEVKEIQVTLAEQVTKDFHDAFSGSNTKMSMPYRQLAEACLVVSVLDQKVKKNLLKWFIDLQLSEYVHLFNEAEDVAWIDKLDKRYAWFKKHLLQIEEKYGAIFPPDWEMSERITVEFCRQTKNELSKIMGKRSNEIDVKLLLFAIQRTKHFENLLGKRFSGVTLNTRNNINVTKNETKNSLNVSEISVTDSKDVNEEEIEDGNIVVEKTKNPLNPFADIIGECFQPYLHIYIQSVDRSLSELVERFVSDTKAELNKEDAACETSPAVVLSSCADLFLFYKKSLVQCNDLSNEQPMLSLANVFQKYLREYVNKIFQPNLPKSNSTAPSLTTSMSNITKKSLKDFQFRVQTEVCKYSPQEISRICSVLSTAEYCLETTQQLEEKLKEKVEPSLAEKINMSQEQDLFHNVISNCIQLLVQDLEMSCEPALTTMSKMAWQTVESVGDQSGYVSAITTHLRSSVPLIRTKLSSSRKYFTQFCIKFANSFIPKFIQHVYKCKPLSTVGAEQLLLDTHSLKTVLLDLPAIGFQGDHRKPPTSYTKIVVKGMTKAEMILKVVMTPTEPYDSFVDQFLKLLPDSDISEFQKILEMKGLKGTERNNLITLFQPHDPGFVTGSQVASPKHDTSSIRKLNNLIKKNLISGD